MGLIVQLIMKCVGKTRPLEGDIRGWDRKGSGSDITKMVWQRPGPQTILSLGGDCNHRERGVWVERNKTNTTVPKCTLLTSTTSIWSVLSPSKILWPSGACRARGNTEQEHDWRHKKEKKQYNLKTAHQNRPHLKEKTTAQTEKKMTGRKKGPCTSYAKLE